MPLGRLARRNLAITPFWNKDEHQEQQLEIANRTEESEISPEEQEINHYLAFCGVSPRPPGRCFIRH